MFSEPLEGKKFEDMTDFEKARFILLRCAYNKGMWEQVPVCIRPYINVKRDRIAYYTEGIYECYEVIAELKKEGRIE